MNAKGLEVFHELSFYTLAHPSPTFIHQHSVDAFTAQTANETTKPIAITFALIGLYLFLDKNYTGRQVQLAHMKLAKNKKPWPKISLPKQGSTITVHDVMNTNAGNERDLMIKQWCEEVWKLYAESRSAIIKIVEEELR